MSSVGFVPEPDSGRGTASLIWTCLATICLATWTSLHLNCGRQRWKHKLWEFGHALLAPELVALQALRDLARALDLKSGLKVQEGWRSISLKQTFLVIKDGLLVEVGEEEAEPLWEDVLLEDAQLKQISFEDLPTDENIDERAKTEWTSKAITSMQSLWFIATTLSRLIENLQVSPLEDMTIAWTFCGLAMFVAWFACPQNLSAPFYIMERPETIVEKEYTPSRPVRYLSSKRCFRLVSSVFIAIFSAFHLAAWNYPFPTQIEGWLWRGCSFVMSIGAVISALLRALDMWLKWDQRFIDLLEKVLFCGYLTGRLMTAGLAFAALRHAPSSLYQKPSWAAYLIHVGS